MEKDLQIFEEELTKQDYIKILKNRILGIISLLLPFSLIEWLVDLPLFFELIAAGFFVWQTIKIIISLQTKKKLVYKGTIIEKKSREVTTSEYGNTTTYYYFNFGSEEIEVPSWVFNKSKQYQKIKLSFTENKQLCFDLKLEEINTISNTNKSRSNIYLLNDNDIKVVKKQFFKVLWRTPLNYLLYSIGVSIFVLIVGLLLYHKLTDWEIISFDLTNETVYIIYIVIYGLIAIRFIIDYTVSIIKYSKDFKKKQKEEISFHVTDRVDDGSIKITVNDNKEYEIPKYVTYTPNANDMIIMELAVNTQIILDIKKDEKQLNR